MAEFVHAAGVENLLHLKICKVCFKKRCRKNGSQELFFKPLSSRENFWHFCADSGVWTTFKVPETHEILYGAQYIAFSVHKSNLLNFTAWYSLTGGERKPNELYGSNT
jgi:hypothetical protein